MSTTGLLRIVPLAALCLVAVFAPAIAPYDPVLSDGPSLAAPSTDHWLGTTVIGQDVLSRVIWGARTSLTVAGLVVVISIVNGVLIGGGAAFIGGWVDDIASRLIDFTIAAPRLPLLIVIGALTPATLWSVVVALSAVMWAPIGRVIRSVVMSLRSQQYIMVARGFGLTRWQVMVRHVAPGIVPVVVAEAISTAPAVILIQATLAFLGLSTGYGVSWGEDLHTTLTAPGVLLTDAWLWWAVPMGVAITVTTASIIAIGTLCEEYASEQVVVK